jgi:hypothetical protein
MALIAPISQIRASSMFLLLIVGNWKEQLMSGHKFDNFCQIRTPDSQTEKEHKHTHTQSAWWSHKCTFPTSHSLSLSHSHSHSLSLSHTHTHTHTHTHAQIWYIYISFEAVSLSSQIK